MQCSCKTVPIADKVTLYIICNAPGCSWWMFVAGLRRDLSEDHTWPVKMEWKEERVMLEKHRGYHRSRGTFTAEMFSYHMVDAGG